MEGEPIVQFLFFLSTHVIVYEYIQKCFQHTCTVLKAVYLTRPYRFSSRQCDMKFYSTNLSLLFISSVCKRKLGLFVDVRFGFYRVISNF